MDTYQDTFTEYQANHTKFIPSKGFHLKNNVSDEIVADDIYHMYFDGVPEEYQLGYFVRVSSRSYSSIRLTDDILTFYSTTATTNTPSQWSNMRS